jgi:hypothetical protein
MNKLSCYADACKKTYKKVMSNEDISMGSSVEQRRSGTSTWIVAFSRFIFDSLTANIAFLTSILEHDFGTQIASFSMFLEARHRSPRSLIKICNDLGWPALEKGAGRSSTFVHLQILPL